ncbi:hypothetical protein LINPERPRIM_LOCUS14830 [Linum perenne]
MVELFFTACALLHNYIREEGGDDIFERAYLHTNDDPSLVVETVDEAPSYVESSEEWTRFRHTLAQHMWATRAACTMRRGSSVDGMMEGTREYRVWTKFEEKILVKCIRIMTNRRLVTKGNFRASGLKELERMMHEMVENYQFLVVPHIKSKSHPKAIGLNNKPLLYWEDLCVIYGVDHALGAEAVQLSDAASKLIGGFGGSQYMDEDTDCTSKPTKNKGKAAASSSRSKRSRQQMADEQQALIASQISMATENIAKIATNYCIEGDLVVKRQFLYQELAKFGELTRSQRTMVLRHLNRDDGDCKTFFQFPTDEEKLEFVWTILE